ncbi:nuclear transport factor 2 family protein [Devosia sp. BK]|uniref:nuclear transport factor 2 family protein n=1 Tax=Devosia sp. BK TaxID=2871706 RepID=UPI00293A8173|nr:nuclear transport factor 2 family protein [Devosia sp. BK]MDV3249845.1 nuclear transport factor 2 family protein [Devosia sp. BK]
MTDPFQSFSAMLRYALADRVDQNAPTYIDMVADDVVMEFPYALPDMVKRVDGKEALRAYLKNVGDMITIDALDNVAVLRTEDPDVTIVEFEGVGTVKASGKPYEQRYISVIRTRQGKIVHYKDYWNPVALMTTAEANPAKKNGASNG